MNNNSEFNRLMLDMIEKMSLQYNNIIGEDKNLSIEKIVGSIINYYESIIGCMPGNVYWLDKNGVALGCNKNVLQMFGLSTLKEFKGLTFDEMGRMGHWLPEATQSFTLDTLDVIKTGKAKLNVEEPPIPQHNGEPVYFLTSRVPLFDESGTVMGVVGISVDITKQKETEKKLISAKEKAEIANKAKTEFLENMRHDIRTPLSGIVGISTLLQRETNKDKVQEFTTKLIEASNELLRFLNEILESINVASGEIPLLKKRFNLKAILSNTIKLNQPKALEKALNLQISIDDAIPNYLMGDPVRIYRIVHELLVNSLKFTKSGSITVSAELYKKEEKNIIIKIIVEDTGPGIPPEKQQDLFVRFKRLTPSYQGIYKGTGLGLAIVKQFVDDLQGEIYVDSHPNKGTKFICVVPIKIALLDEPLEDETSFFNESN
jgi:two-component system aerobic respiration control sensor histidine kinase ArcB